MASANTKFKAEHGLLVVGDSNFEANVEIGGDLQVSGNATIIGTLTTASNTVIEIQGSTTIANTFTVIGAANVTQSVAVGANVFITNNSVTTGNSTVNTVISSAGIDTDGTLAVLGTTTLSNTLAAGNTNITGTANVSTQLNVGANVNLTTTNINVGNSTVNTSITSTAIDTDGSLSVAGAATVGLTLGVTRAATFSNTIGVTGATTLSNTIAVTGAATFSNTVGIVGDATFTKGASFGSTNTTFDTDTLVIDAVNDRVSINAASSTVALYVNGSANVENTLTTSAFAATTGSITTLTANSLTVTGLVNTNIDSGTLFVDATNNRVGIACTIPDAVLSVVGTANVSGSSRFGSTMTIVGSLTGAAASFTSATVTGNTTANAINAAGVVTATGGFVGTLTGTASSATSALNANTCSRTVTAGSYMTGGGQLSADRTLSVDATSAATANKVVARDASSNFSANTITAALAGVATSANNVLLGGVYVAATTANTASTIMGRDINGDTSVRVLNGTATSARYADLAEKYLADAEYDPGTVMCIGGDDEVTACMNWQTPIGVVSTNPAYMMNSELEGGTYVALKGRVPVKVVGMVRKGESLYASSTKGVGSSVVNGRAFAISLEDSMTPEVRLVEALVL